MPLCPRLWDVCAHAYYYVFDHCVLYPLMQKISGCYNIVFLNLGYAPKDDEMLWARSNVKINDEALKAHYMLYEKALSLHPQYPSLEFEMLDVGCGLGGGMQLLKTVHPEIKQLAGVDLCTKTYPDLNIIKASAEQLPFASESVDVVINIESSHLYKHPDRFFSEAYRVLRVGGCLCWADLRLQKESIFPLERARAAGFENIAYENINAQILNGLQKTAANYDKKLKTASKVLSTKMKIKFQTPWFIQAFGDTLRSTYCAPGTKNYARFENNEKLYYVACWRKEVQSDAQSESSSACEAV